MTDRSPSERGPRASTNERLQAALDRSEYHLSTLQEVSRELARAGDEEAIFRIALSTMMGALGAASGLALMSSAEDGALSLAGAMGLDGNADDLPRSLDWHDVEQRDALSQALLLGPALRRAPGSGKPAARSAARLLARYGLKAWIPLSADGELVGGIGLGPRLLASRYEPSDLQLLGAVAAHCAASIQGYRLLSHNLLIQQEKLRLHGLLEEHLDPRIVERLLGGEGRDSRRIPATILVADLRGFTWVSDQLEPEDVVGLLNRFLTRMTGVIFSHNGIIDKFIGDAIMVIFDDPDSGPAQATACALAMQAAFNDLQPMAAGPIEDVFQGGMGIGISSGEVVLGRIGGGRRADFTVVGSPVNLAHRLCEQAPGGQVLADGRTFGAVEARVRTATLRPMMFKGVAQPMPVHQILELA